ncbi:uncharacterized protein BKA78DRAFT_298692 [Phyllosticta capitalensis]|uniref:uncharacterized protein n=1 Tax=Phyllosticta capitalensis TaxID=121624 RepID=UPI0031305E8F
MVETETRKLEVGWLKLGSTRDTFLPLAIATHPLDRRSQVPRASSKTIPTPHTAASEKVVQVHPRRRTPRGPWPRAQHSGSSPPRRLLVRLFDNHVPCARPAAAQPTILRLSAARRRREVLARSAASHTKLVHCKTSRRAVAPVTIQLGSERQQPADGRLGVVAFPVVVVAFLAPLPSSRPRGMTASPAHPPRLLFSLADI